MQKSVNDMSFEMFRGIIDRYECATEVHIIGSGEPLLSKDLYKMADYAASKKMTVKTFSNGTTISDNIDNLLNSRLNGITISINGHNSKEFERMTGMSGKIYNAICDAVSLLIKERNKRHSRLKVKTSFIVDKENYKFMPLMADLALEMGADHVFLCSFLPCPYGDLTAERRMLPAGKKIISEIRAMFRHYPDAARKKMTFPMLLDANSDINNCKTHFSQIRFDGDGNVSSCSMMLLNMTDLGKYQDAHIWNNGHFKKMRNVFLSHRKELLPEPCAVCPDNKGVHVI